MMIEVPSALKQTLVEVHGRPGLRFFACLPTRVEILQRQWAIVIGEPFPDLSYSLVYGVRRRDGSPAVLKLRVPGPEAKNEAAMLRFYRGDGAVKLLRFDTRVAAFLLEELEPGTSLAEQEDAMSQMHFCRVWERLDRRGRDLASGLTGRLPTLTDWAQAFSRYRRRFQDVGGPLPTDLLGRTERDLMHLLASTRPEDVRVLHGDLHCGNLRAQGADGYKAIDPKGVVGDRAYEVAAFLRDRILGERDPEGALRRRLRSVCREGNLDPARTARWGRAAAVLSALWSVEDGDRGYESALAVAGLFETLPWVRGREPSQGCARPRMPRTPGRWCGHRAVGERRDP